MSYGTRADVLPGAALHLAVVYDAEGKPIGSAGPYAYEGSAKGQCGRLLRQYWRRGTLARVVTSTPEWSPVNRTEMRP
jgi:hypothetical protein